MLVAWPALYRRSGGGLQQGVGRGTRLTKIRTWDMGVPMSDEEYTRVACFCYVKVILNVNENVVSQLLFGGASGE